MFHEKSKFYKFCVVHIQLWFVPFSTATAYSSYSVIKVPDIVKTFCFHLGPNIFKNMKSTNWINAMSQFLCIQNSRSKQSASHIAEADIPTFATEE